MQINCKLRPFPLKKNPAEMSRWSNLSHNVRQYLLHQKCVNTTFLHGNGLKWNCKFHGSICYALYMHILCFYFVWQKCWHFLLKVVTKIITFTWMNSLPLNYSGLQFISSNSGNLIILLHQSKNNCIPSNGYGGGGTSKMYVDVSGRL